MPHNRVSPGGILVDAPGHIPGSICMSKSEEQAEREERYHLALIAAWWAMIETLGWGEHA